MPLLSEGGLEKRQGPCSRARGSVLFVLLRLVITVLPSSTRPRGREDLRRYLNLLFFDESTVLSVKEQLWPLLLHSDTLVLGLVVSGSDQNLGTQGLLPSARLPGWHLCQQVRGDLQDAY